MRAIAIPFTNAIPQKAVLDAEHCGTCGTCARVCPTDAIEFDQQPRNADHRTDAVIVASGFRVERYERQAAIQRRAQQEHHFSADAGALARSAWSVWPRAAALGWQDSVFGRFCAVRGFAR